MCTKKKKKPRVKQQSFIENISNFWVIGMWLLWKRKFFTPKNSTIMSFKVENINHTLLTVNDAAEFKLSLDGMQNICACASLEIILHFVVVKMFLRKWRVHKSRQFSKSINKIINEFDWMREEYDFKSITFDDNNYTDSRIGDWIIRNTLTRTKKRAYVTPWAWNTKRKKK